MAHVSDFTQAGDKIVLDLINEDNNSALALTVVSVALASAGSPTTKNTLATVTSLPGSGYNGSVDLEYNRLAIGDFVDLYYPNGLLIPQGEATTLFDFLPEINAGLAVNLTAADLADQPLADWEGIPNETQEVNAAILAGSLVYTGTLTFTVDSNDIPMSSVITVTVLSGLNLPVSQQVAGLWGTAGLGFLRIGGDPQNLGVGSVIDWGDGTSTTVTEEGQPVHEYTTAGPHRWEMKTYVAPEFSPPTPFFFSGNAMLTIENWDFMQGWAETHNGYFVNLTQPIPGAPPGSASGFLHTVPNYLPPTVTNISGSFGNCQSLNCDLSGWDTSNVTGMDGVFSGCKVFNGNVTTWDTSNVTNMDWLFQGTLAFNQDISGWDVSNVTNFSLMFQDAVVFNQPIGNWNVGNAEYMIGMFQRAASFNQDLSGWEVSDITYSEQRQDFDQGAESWVLPKPNWSV